MRTLAFALLVALCTFFSTIRVEASPDPAYVCSFCLIILGLVEESVLQVNLERSLEAKCGDSKICQRAVKELILSLEKKAVPEDICKEINMCTGDCKLFSQWPVDPLPAAPPAWPIERRALSAMVQNTEPSSIKENIMDLDIPRKLDVLKPVFQSFMLEGLPAEWGMWAHVSLAMANVMTFDKATNQSKALVGDDEKCGIQCKIQNIVDHKPLQDHDQDRFSTLQAKRLRGSDWRGYDCDDKHADVYPGRKVTSHDASVDHNCNGIVGRNSTGRYEDLFCANSSPRGLVILGDSATAHFHIPPQWLTADGWNFNQLLPDALNEIDVPHCSWGTGHVTPEECPYQRPIPGNENNAIISLYTQMRDRNRCNHNDFQNIGVNGARITSSMQLANAMARNPENDNPLLVWLALIGNDICNGHPDFTHMTSPENFYTHAMETLTALDQVVPAGSHVVSLALFDGELLYQTMHNHIHPVGTKYQQMYDFMNCLEENPCWGWLNSNATVRRISTVWSNNLNRVYQNISNHQDFKNFKFIFYSPDWVNIFNGKYSISSGKC